MESKDKEKFAVIMWGLTEEFGGTISKENIQMRFRSLSEFSIEQVTAACNWLFDNREATFPVVPRTKEIRDAIKRISGELNPKAKAEMECDKIFKKLYAYGREALPLFYDEKTKYLMTHRWTFEQLGNIKEDDLKWFRKSFVEAYLDFGETIPAMIDGPNKKQIPHFSAKKI